MVIPLSLICSDPSIILNNSCELVVLDPQRQSSADSIPGCTPPTMSIGGSSLQSNEAIATNSENSKGDFIKNILFLFDIILFSYLLLH